MKTGGCVCGAVRYEAPDDPLYTVVCHCAFCQRATGSAFAVWPTFSHTDVKLTGALKTYEHRSDESGRWIRLNFCLRCGTTVTSIKVDRHVWTRSKQHWFSVPGGVPAFEKSSRT